MKHALVTSCDSRFATGAEALLRSVQVCHPDVHRICFVPPREYEQLLPRLGPLGDIRSYPALVRGVPANRQSCVGRLFCASVDAEVAAYVDADAVFCRPAPELWEVAAGRVNAVLDDSIVISNNLNGDNLVRFIAQFPEVASKKGVNSGVFALRPSDWKDLICIFEQVLEKGGYCYESILDQPLLNAVFSGRINVLSRDFNAHALFDHRVPSRARIVHFTGRAKPWQPEFPKHEPAYWCWLRYGGRDCSSWALARSRMWIALNSPKRLIGRWLRNVMASRLGNTDC